MAGDVFARPVFARARRLCLALPETTEATSWGHPNFRAGRKTFCAFEMIKGRPSIAVKLAAADASRVLARRDGFATPYGRGQWASVWVDGDIDWSRIQALIERGYRNVATKRMLTLLDVPEQRG